MQDYKVNKPLGKNTIDNLTDALVSLMKYSDSQVEYPDISGAKSDDGVIAEWFYPIYNGINDFSELTAIHMYTSQETKFENIGELMLGIGLTEMKHYAKIGDFICKLGGNIEQRYRNSEVVVGKTEKEALSVALEAEVKTIEFYNTLSNKIQKVKSTKTTRIALELIAKLTADEEVHKKLLEDALYEISRKEEGDAE